MVIIYWLEYEDVMLTLIKSLDLLIAVTHTDCSKESIYLALVVFHSPEGRLVEPSKPFPIDEQSPATVITHTHKNKINK